MLPAVPSIVVKPEWFLIRTSASKERMASNLLRARGFDTYCPMRQIWRYSSRYARRQEKVAREIALFPRYIFVSFLDNSDWLDLFEPECVLSWVGMNGAPYRIANVLIDEWREQFGEKLTGPKFQRWMKSNAEFLAGDMVTVIQGTFADSTKPVEVAEIRGRAAKVWSQLFGGRYIWISLDNLERVV